MSLHLMLFSAIFYAPFLSAPVAFSMCYSLTMCPASISVASLHVLGLSLHVFTIPTGFCSHLCECHFLNSSVVFSDLFASCVALDSQLVLHSWAETVFCLSIQPKIISSVFPESPSEGYRSRICARAADQFSPISGTSAGCSQEEITAW